MVGVYLSPWSPIVSQRKYSVGVAWDTVTSGCLHHISGFIYERSYETYYYSELALVMIGALGKHADVQHKWIICHAVLYVNYSPQLFGAALDAVHLRGWRDASPAI